MRYVAIIVLALLALVEFLVRALIFLVLSLLMLPALMLYDFLEPSVDDMLKPYLLTYMERLMEEPPPKVVVDPAKALADSYAEGKLTHEEFEDALTLTMANR